MYLPRNSRALPIGRLKAFDEFIKAICEIQTALPDATKDMIAAFMDQEGVTPRTVLIWARSGVLSVINGEIKKTSSHPLTDKARQDKAIEIIRSLQKPDSRRSLPFPHPGGFGR